MAKTYSLKMAQKLVDQAVHEFQLNLERYMEIAWDIRKAISYNRGTGQWTWHDRNEEALFDNEERLFKTFWEALYDAVEPYLYPEDEEDDEEPGA